MFPGRFVPRQTAESRAIVARVAEVMGLTQRFNLRPFDDLPELRQP